MHLDGSGSANSGPKFTKYLQPAHEDGDIYIPVSSMSHDQQILAYKHTELDNHVYSHRLSDGPGFPNMWAATQKQSLHLGEWLASETNVGKLVLCISKPALLFANSVHSPEDSTLHLLAVTERIILQKPHEIFGTLFFKFLAIFNCPEPTCNDTHHGECPSNQRKTDGYHLFGAFH